MYFPLTSPAITCLGLSPLITAVCVLLSCHDSHDSVKGTTVVGKVQKRNRYQAFLGIHKTTIVPDYELLGEAEYFSRFGQGIFHDKTRSYRTVEETKVNSIISSMFSKTSRLRLAPEMIPTPK